MRLVMAQSNLVVGDIEGNGERILTAAQRSVAEHDADLVIFPELALTGYPPEDLLLRPSLNSRVRQVLAQLQAELPVAIVVGYAAVRQGGRVNVAGFMVPGKAPVEYFKNHLSNARGFDEQRYFLPGDDICIIEHAGLRLGLGISEDIYHSDFVERVAASGADVLLSLNAAVFRQGGSKQRFKAIQQQAQEHQIPVVLCQLVGGQDELVFDGGSMAISADGDRVVQAPLFTDCLWPMEMFRRAGSVTLAGVVAEVPNEEAATWNALVLGLRDYVKKNGFERVLLGLSGGIDSALTLAIAVEAVGADKVQAIMMPYEYTLAISLEDAEAEARLLGVDYQVLPIATAVEAFSDLLAPLFKGAAVDTTEENLQARCRGVLLMALSNKHGALVLSTGNKSEVAVGYSTLYGDTVGGFAVLKDVSKTWVYRLARYANKKAGQAIIPQRVISRAPTAELAPGQTDQDNLPDYDLLDEILTCYVEKDMSAEATIRAGYDRDTVYSVVRRVDRNEYKRRQAAVGPKITSRSFGKDRRYPITNGWQPGD